MKTKNITLSKLKDDDREQFIIDNHLDSDGEIISRKTIEKCIDDEKSETYRIIADGKSS